MTIILSLWLCYCIYELYRAKQTNKNLRKINEELNEKLKQETISNNKEKMV